MFENDAKEHSAYVEFTNKRWGSDHPNYGDVKTAYQKGAEITLKKVIKYFSTRVLDENCGGYFSHLLEDEERLQELSNRLENI